MARRDLNTALNEGGNVGSQGEKGYRREGKGREGEGRQGVGVCIPT